MNLQGKDLTMVNAYVIQGPGILNDSIQTEMTREKVNSNDEHPTNQHNRKIGRLDIYNDTKKTKVFPKQ